MIKKPIATTRSLNQLTLKLISAIEKRWKNNQSALDHRVLVVVAQEVVQMIFLHLFCASKCHARVLTSIEKDIYFVYFSVGIFSSNFLKTKNKHGSALASIWSRILQLAILDCVRIIRCTQTNLNYVIQTIAFWARLLASVSVRKYNNSNNGEVWQKRSAIAREAKVKDKSEKFGRKQFCIEAKVTATGMRAGSRQIDRKIDVFF